MTSYASRVMRATPHRRAIVLLPRRSGKSSWIVRESHRLLAADKASRVLVLTRNDERALDGNDNRRLLVAKCDADAVLFSRVPSTTRMHVLVDEGATWHVDTLRRLAARGTTFRLLATPLGSHDDVCVRHRLAGVPVLSHPYDVQPSDV